jgi:hypothetical protein
VWKLSSTAKADGGGDSRAERSVVGFQKEEVYHTFVVPPAAGP